MADRDKALEAALGQIEKQFGKGSIMRLGENERMKIGVIPTGSIALDLALGVGGLPRGRVVEIYGTESSGKTTIALHVVAEAQKAGGIAAFIDAEHALDPAYTQALGVNLDEMLISQPDTGEQGLEIADTLIRSGAVDIVVIDSVAALVPRAEIEGEMGDSHMGLQARLMSQALRKLSGNLARSKTCALFINQLREKIGVMFGCFSYGTRVTLADGTQERIGKIVTQKMPVEVLSYDFDTNEVVKRRVVNWFRNGKTDRFLQFTVAKPTGNGKAQFAATPNHKIRTPAGWKEAQELRVGERVLIAAERRLSDFQWQVIRGGLMGDAALSRHSRRNGDGELAGVRFRMGHGAAQREYLDWKASLFANIPMSRMTDERGAVFADLTPLAELSELRQGVYAQKRKTFDETYLKGMTPLSLAIWYMDDGHLDVRNEAATSARIQICVQAMTPETRERLVAWLRDTWDLDVRLTTIRGKQIVVFSKEAAEEFQSIVASFIHPSMEYKLLPQYRGRFNVTPEFAELTYDLAPAVIRDIHAKPLTRSMQRFDIEVEGSHSYFVDGVLVHNSPETTPGGRALKFYSSVRLDVRRIENLKDGAEVVGSRTRAKVVKNKVAPPFRQAEFDILYGKGISKEGSLIDVGVDLGMVKKSGAWFTYEGTQIGQGRENARQFLIENPDIALDIEKRIRDATGLVPQEGDDAVAVPGPAVAPDAVGDDDEDDDE